MWSLFKNIIDAVLPPRCISCGKIIADNSGLCSDCFNKINFISAPYCHKCGRPFTSSTSDNELICGHCLQHPRSIFRMNRSAVIYDDLSKNLIVSLKFMDKTDNAPTLAKWLNLAGRDIWQAGVDVMIPVPLHYWRLLKRRYNQCGLLCKELHKLNAVPVDYKSLIKCRHTKPQVAFSGKDRTKNLRGAFKVKHPELIKGKRIVLIDDVMTTGSTLKECCKVLKQAGAKSVDTLTVARVI